MKIFILTVMFWTCFIPVIGQQSFDPPLTHIRGGTPTGQHEFPFVVRLDWPDHFCSASLIADHWILTAAHCVVEGDGSISKPTRATYEVSYKSEINRSIGRVIPYPDYYYKGAGFWYDVALVEVLEPFQSEHIRPVELLNKVNENRYARPGTRATVLGYGRGSGTNYDTLLMAELSVWPGVSCWPRFNNTLDGGIVHEHTVCSYESGKGTGSGDSGGPVLVNTPRGWSQVGVNSITTLTVSVSTRVSSIYDWVQGEIGEELPTLVFPQYANGVYGGFSNRTRLVLRNLAEASDSVVVEYLDSSGQGVDSQTYTVPGSGSVDVQSSGTGDLSVGPLTVTSQSLVSELHGTVIYDFLGYLVSVPSSQLTTEAEVFLSKSADENTALAFYNPSSMVSLVLSLTT